MKAMKAMKAIKAIEAKHFKTTLLRLHQTLSQPLPFVSEGGCINNAGSRSGKSVDNKGQEKEGKAVPDKTAKQIGTQ